MAEDGAAIIDIGGESTRPGAPAIGAQQEMDRVVPVVEALRKELDVPLSIDTSKPEVMRAAVAAGAGMINDVTALGADDAMEVAAATGVPICLMHMQGTPRTMQQDPEYDSVVDDIFAYLKNRIAVCEAAGIAPESTYNRPGIRLRQDARTQSGTARRSAVVSADSVCRSWSESRASRCWARLPGERSTSAWPPVWLQRCWLPNGAPISSGFMMSEKRSMP